MLQFIFSWLGFIILFLTSFKFCFVSTIQQWYPEEKEEEEEEEEEENEKTEKESVR
jgi:hypothetical protein